MKKSLKFKNKVIDFIDDVPRKYPNFPIWFSIVSLILVIIMTIVSLFLELRY